MANNEIKVEHEAIVIEYREYVNKWEFIVDGKEYSVDSLLAAKEKIDGVLKALRLKTRKAFEPISAYYGEDHGRITSIAEGTVWRSDTKQVWFVHDGGRKSKTKISITSLAKDTPKNAELIQAIKACQQKETELRKQVVHMTNGDLPDIEG